MKEFVFKKCDWGLTVFAGYYSRRKMLPKLKKYKKYRLGFTKNNIPIYRWNWVMWFQIIINGKKRKIPKSVGVVGATLPKIKNIPKRNNRKPDKELV